MRPLHLLLATILLVPAPCWPLPEAALARLELALQDAVRSNRPAEVVRVLVLAGELKARLGDRRALVLVRKAVERAQVLDDPRLVHWAALVAAQVARRLGDGTDPFLYLKVAQEAVERGRLDSLYPTVYPVTLAAGDLPRLPAAPPEPEVRVPRKTPFGNFSQRASVELFNRRVREDPAYLDTLVRLKSFQEYHRSPGVQTLEYPGIHVDEPTTFDGEFKRVKEAYKYYQFLMKLSRTWDDKFGLATIYVNLTFVRSIRHPAMEVVYYLTKAGAAAEAVSRIIRMSVTGWSMDLAILALNKVLIDVIERASRRREPGDRGER